MSQKIYIEIPESTVAECLKVLDTMKNPDHGGSTPPPGVLHIRYGNSPADELKSGKLKVWWEKRKLAYIVVGHRKVTINVKREPTAHNFALSFGDITPHATSTATQSTLSSSSSSQSLSSSTSSTGSSQRVAHSSLQEAKPGLEPFVVDPPRAYDWSFVESEKFFPILRCRVKVRRNERSKEFDTNFNCVEDVQHMNAVFRELGEDLQRCLMRVSFSCEDAFDPDAQRQLAQQAELVLRRGILVGNDLYEFALTSASSIRESSAWFVCSRGGSTTDAHALRRRLGDFSHLPPEKLAGRLGQAFSQTIGGVRIDDISVVGVCDDVLNLYGYNFTDGVGRISPEYACTLCEALGLMLPEDIPAEATWRSPAMQQRTIKAFLRTGKLKSAFQIRLGGTKGMLVLDPSLPQNGKHIYLRPSMIKFPSPLCRLEVCKYSQSASGRLNSEFLRVLDFLGTPHEVILERARDELIEAQEMLQNPTSALNYMRSNNDPYLTPAIEMLLARFPMDSFLTSIIADMHKQRISAVQNGHIPVKHSRFAFGVIDEVGILAEDEIFYQYSDDTDITPLEAPKIIISKNPCRHPGDVRIMRAKFVPALSHLVDVIVFPQRGNRPVTDQIGGSDLDGDEYFICWDHDIVAPTKSVAPADYQSDKVIWPTADDTPFVVQPPISNIPPLDENSISRVIKFFCDAIQQAGAVGRIAKAQDRWAALEGGIGRRECKELAKEINKAIDAPKTGIFPNPDPQLMKPPPEPEIPINLVEKVMAIANEFTQEYSASPQSESKDIDPVLRPYSDDEAHRLQTLFEMNFSSAYDAKEIELVGLFQELLKYWKAQWASYLRNHSNGATFADQNRNHKRVATEKKALFMEQLQRKLRQIFLDRMRGKSIEELWYAARVIYLHDHLDCQKQTSERNPGLCRVFMGYLTAARCWLLQQKAVDDLRLGRLDGEQRDRLLSAAFFPVTVHADIRPSLKFTYRGLE
eukprot:TRINITY_DN15394_c0_g1_i1.p1 TRINITY_DN15394_c0_g1~~TRINITY_DN15394_c0_g1_i1.p1  ORF type:complete len:974 (-),score=133.73 TRINITY_DN15394_c0_g1_i1:8-2929(-)